MSVYYICKVKKKKLTLGPAGPEDPAGPDSPGGPYSKKINH